MPHLHLLGVRRATSGASAAHVLQGYTGLPLAEARRMVEEARAGKRVRLQVDEEYVAHDLAALLGDLGVVVEVDDSL
jgi:hypothetical protein